MPYKLHERDLYSYEFITDEDIVYKIYFFDYSYMFAEYQQIISPGYTFNIEVI